MGPDRRRRGRGRHHPFRQAQLGDLTFVELPQLGDEAVAGAEIGSVESVKAASELIALVSGTVTEVNTALESAPETVNADPYGKGWLVKVSISDASFTAGLLDADAYAAYCENR